MAAEKTLDSRLYESGRGHEVADTSSDHEFTYLTRKVLLIGGNAATVFHAHLVDDPEDRIFALNIGASAFLQLDLRIDIVKSSTTCTVIGIW